MSTQILIAAGAAFLFAGMAQAATPEAQQDREQITIAHQEAAARKAGQDAHEDAATRMAKESVQELHPEARPVYLNGGHFGSGE